MKIKPALFALLIGGLMLMTSIAFVFAFMQQAEAKRQASLAIELEKNAVECELYNHKIKNELNHEADSLKQLIDELKQKMHLLEEQAAAKSKNKQ